MNLHPCEVAGCAALRGPRTYSPYCQAHRLTQTRHGHPLQSPVRVHELLPFRATARALRKRNPDSAVWSVLHERWEALLGHARGLLEARDSGKTFHAPTAQAAEMLRRVAERVEFAIVCEWQLAVLLFEAENQARFKSDRALRFALVRRLRLLAPVNVGTYWDHKRQRVTGVYRDAPPKAVDILGGWLVEVFGLAGRLLAEQERRRAQLSREEQQRLVAAVAALR